MSTLKKGLSESEYDRVREVLGLEPLKIAQEKGKGLTAKVRDTVEN